MSDLINIYKWRSASKEEINLIKRWCRDRFPFQISAFILAGAVFIVPCVFLLIVNAIYVQMTFIYPIVFWYLRIVSYTRPVLFEYSQLPTWSYLSKPLQCH